MKKNTVIISIFSFVLISSIQADIRLGLKAGVNLANASFNKDVIQTSNFTGFQAGPIVEFDIPVIGIKVDAAVLYSRQGLKSSNTDFEGKENTLDVPINLKLKFGLINQLKVFLTAGPYASFKLSGDNLVWNEVLNELKNESFGAGINFGGGIELLRHLQVGVNYKISLTDDYKSLDAVIPDLKGRKRIWSITAAYFF